MARKRRAGQWRPEHSQHTRREARGQCAHRPRRQCGHGARQRLGQQRDPGGHLRDCGQSGCTHRRHRDGDCTDLRSGAGQGGGECAGHRHGGVWSAGQQASKSVGDYATRLRLRLPNLVVALRTSSFLWEMRNPMRGRCPQGSRCIGCERMAPCGLDVIESTGWWRRGGSNSRPSHCERDALPAELRPHEVKIPDQAMPLRLASSTNNAE
jgi:hypothetical protein